MIANGVFTDLEMEVIGAAREKLSAAGFGITLDNQHIFLRMQKGSIHLVIAGVFPDSMRSDECFTCGGQEDLRPAKIVIVQANGKRIERDAKTCTYCRVPQ